MEHDRTAYLVKMANQIADFFDAQAPGDEKANAQAVAGHLKLFWAPSMRERLVQEFDAGHLVDLHPSVEHALQDHRDALLSSHAHVRGEAAQTFPQGGGDAG